MKPIAKPVLACAAAAALAVPAAPLAAQGMPTTMVVNGDIKAEKTVTDAEGKTRIELVVPDTFLPGDRLLFITNYSNGGAEAATNFTITNPVNPAVRLAPDADPALDVSVDGGKSWGKLAALSLFNPDGTQRPATHADVTHVRWVLARVAPGEAGQVAYPVIIR
jgi:hypothetical protein